jgi:uncharacterized protein (TIGR03437 family)
MPALRCTRFAATAFVFAAVLSAQTGPGIIPIGSPLTFGGTNAPDNYSAVTTFSSTQRFADTGAVKIWQEQTPTGITGEWDVFYLQIANNGPVAGDINSDWNIKMNYTLSQAAYFDQVVNQWLVSGTPVNPLMNGIGTICCAAASNPVLPGEAYYNSGFSSPLAAGVQQNWQQIFVNPYSFVSAGGINPSTANEFIFALHFTLQPPIFTTALATAYQVEPFAPQAIVAAFGTNLTVGTAPATEIPLPTTLSGTSITVTDSAGVTRPAPLYYVSPLQVNYEIPPDTALGAATVTMTPTSGLPGTETIQIGNVSPGLFQLNSSGLAAAWALPIVNGVQQPLEAVYQISGTSLVPLAINLGEPTYLELYGTGIRNAANVTVTVGGDNVPVLFAGAAPDEVGEDQVNIGPLPTSLIGKGSVDIVLTADGQVANTVNITIQ